MKITRSFEGAEFVVEVSIQSKTPSGHSFLSDHQERYTEFAGHQSDMIQFSIDQLYMQSQPKRPEPVG